MRPVLRVSSASQDLEHAGISGDTTEPQLAKNISRKARMVWDAFVEM